MDDLFDVVHLDVVKLHDVQQFLLRQRDNEYEKCLSEVTNVKVSIIFDNGSRQ